MQCAATSLIKRFASPEEVAALRRLCGRAKRMLLPSLVMAEAPFKNARRSDTQRDTGLQVASIFHAFGSRIQLLEAGPHILPHADGDVAAAVATAFRGSGMVVQENFGAIESFEKYYSARNDSKSPEPIVS